MLENWKMRNAKIWRVDVLGADKKVPRSNADGTVTAISGVTRREARKAASRYRDYNNIVEAFVRRDMP